MRKISTNTHRLCEKWSEKKEIECERKMCIELKYANDPN